MPMTKRDAEKLARRMGAKFHHACGNHDIWQTVDGMLFPIPRHPGDLTPGVEKSIKKALGVK